MSAPDISQAEIEAVNEVLRGRSLSRGSQLSRFEESFARTIGRNHASGVSSGTAGLHLSVVASGIADHDLVITPPFSFVASANVMLYERAYPIFVDVDPETGNIDPARVQEAAELLSNRPDSPEARRLLPPSLREGSPPLNQLKAILPIHVFGQPADMDPIMRIASQYGLTVIEDACEAVGAEYRGKKVGTFGDFGVFAFYPNKQMTTGEGGIVCVDEKEQADLLESLKNQGRDDSCDWLCHVRLGYNYRLDEMSAALGRIQLERLDELLDRRRQVAEWYNARLQDLEGIETPRIVPDTTRMSWFVYVIRVNPPVRRNEIMHGLRNHKIPSRPYFAPIHLQGFYRQRFGYGRGDFPVSEELGDISLALPFSAVMTEDQVDSVCHHLRNCVELK